MSAMFTGGIHPPSNSSVSPQQVQCSDSTLGRFVLTAVLLMYVLIILPLSAFVLYVGFQRWRHQRSASSAAVTAHSDIFTYNMAVTELIGTFGYTFYYCSSYSDFSVMSSVGLLFGSFTWPGQTLIPLLTCVERYLAAVHPITYRGLRHAGIIRIRNISTGSVWCVCFLWAGLMILMNFHYYFRYVTAVFMMILFLLVMVFCSLSVLCVLTRPVPGKGDRDRVQADQSKKRAMRTILIIMGVLWLQFGGHVIVLAVKFLALVGVECVTEAFTFVFFLPGGVLSPVLFLHRAKKRQNCQHVTGFSCKMKACFQNNRC